MGFIIKVLITAAAAIVAAYLLPGVRLNSLETALLVGLALAVLNTFIKPILVVLTIPVTILTLGLFLLVINAILVKVADYFIDGFTVPGLLSALIFSLIVSVVSFIINMFVDND